MVITTKKINTQELREWKNENDFPILSFMGIYNATKLIDDIKAYIDQQKASGQEDYQIIAMQQIFCNFATLQKLRRIISDNWEHYNLDITGDNSVEWKKNKTHDYLNYSRTVSKKIKAAIIQDFANFSCGIDDTLEEDIIIFTDGKEEEKEGE